MNGDAEVWDLSADRRSFTWVHEGLAGLVAVALLGEALGHTVGPG